MLRGQLQVMEKITQRAAQANGTSSSKQRVVGGTKQDRDREEEVKSALILCTLLSINNINTFLGEGEGKPFIRI